ncbi:MAG: sugar phosphate isomerase/epimerase [Lentisphaeria bacterium]|nr:sugar phosphate isomerase/epimerase [Lentisphaeria bacterium]
MKFSMMTYTLMRQGCFTPEDCVRVASELGMEGIDWITTYRRDPRELKKMSTDAGLSVAAHTFFFRGDDFKDFNYKSVGQKSMDDACILGAPVIMIVPVPFAGVEDAAENRKRWTEILANVAPYAEERNLAMTVENFPGLYSPFVTADDFYEVKKQVPSLKLTFDNGNAASGEDQVESLKRCFADVVHVHFKDWDIIDHAEDGWRPMQDGRFYRAALIGEGKVDSRATLKTLEELGYDGFINIEYESNKYPGDEAVKRALEYLRK